MLLLSIVMFKIESYMKHVAAQRLLQHAETCHPGTFQRAEAASGRLETYPPVKKQPNISCTMCTTYIWLKKLTLGSLHLGYRNPITQMFTITQMQADPRSPDHGRPHVVRCNMTGRPASTHGWLSTPVSHPYVCETGLTVCCGGQSALPASP